MTQFQLRKELRKLTRVRSPSGKIHLKVPNDNYLTICNNVILDTWERLGRSTSACTCKNCAEGILPSEKPPERDWSGPILDNKFKSFGGTEFTSRDAAEVRYRYSQTEWEVPKYILFIEKCLENGYSISLYNAQKTVSKYVTVSNGSKEYKVRFSNHKPSYYRELHKDCDFFVGITNLGVTTWEDAWDATVEYLGG